MQVKKVYQSNNLTILIDGSFYFYQSYYAFSKMTNTIGDNIGAIYGTLYKIKKLILNYKPTTIIVVFDNKYKTFRNLIYKDYKSNRLPMPNELKNQIIPLYKIIEAIGLPIISINGFEADDIIGTLAVSEENKGNNVLISTGDKDMIQLISSNIKIINDKSNKIINLSTFEKKFGFSTKLFIDYLALIGDKSDNIPGVPGIGIKTSSKLIKCIGSIESIYDKINYIFNFNLRGTKNIINNLLRYKELAFISYSLAKIKTDINLDNYKNKLNKRKPNTKKLFFLMKYYKCNNLIKYLNFSKWIDLC